MNAPEIKGWCPGALRPMLSGDGWIVRLRPRGGRLSVDQARGVAALAALHGNGQIDLSSRANLQLRGVREDGHAALVNGLRALGLADDSAEAEARRNVTVTPFQAANDGTADIAAALETALAGAEAPMLPGKFGFTVDTGPIPVLRAVPHDIAIERDAAGLLVRPAGAMTAARAVDGARAVALAMGLARWFAASGGIAHGRGRMAAHLVRADLPAVFRAVPVAPAAFHPAPGPCRAGFLLALAFGQTGAATLATLADFGPLRLTPWRMLLVEGLLSAPALPGLIADPADPLLRVVACTGAPGCPQAHRPTRPLARRLAPFVPPGETLHVAGCAKGCAHPAPADITLAATPGGWRLIRGGNAAADGAILAEQDLEPTLAAQL